MAHVAWNKKALQTCAKFLVRLSSTSESINNWAKHICACFFEILPVIGKCLSQTPFNWSIRVNMHVYCLETNALLLQRVVETMIDAIIPRKQWLNKTLITQIPHTGSQKSCWANWTINWSTSFEVVALCSLCWLRNSLNIPKPLKADSQASFKIKKGRNSTVLGHLKCT